MWGPPFTWMGIEQEWSSRGESPVLRGSLSCWGQNSWALKITSKVQMWKLILERFATDALEPEDEDWAETEIQLNQDILCCILSALIQRRIIIMVIWHLYLPNNYGSDQSEQHWGITKKLCPEQFHIFILETTYLWEKLTQHRHSFVNIFISNTHKTVFAESV